MIVPPGRSLPSRSAASSIRSPIRSLFEPPGLRNSSLTSNVGARLRPSFWSLTTGVPPIRPSSVGYSRAMARSLAPRLVPEVPAAREDHHGACRMDRGDDLGIPLRSAGLDDRRDAGVEGELDPVRKREERVGGEGGAVDAVPVLAGLPERDPNRVDAAHLAGADPERLQPAGDHDRVRRDVLADPPGEEEVAPVRLGRLAADRDHPLPVVDVAVAVLDEQAAEDALVVALAG